MARDPLLWKRGAFVLPGGLLAAYSILGMAYGLWLRVPANNCGKGQVLLAGCQNIAVVLLPVLLLGIALVAVGLVRYRARPAEPAGHLEFGTGMHFTLLLFGSLVVVLLAELVWVGMRQASLPAGEYLVMEAGGTRFQSSFVLQLLLLGSLLGLAVAGGVFVAHNRLRASFLAALETRTDPAVSLRVEAPPATAATDPPAPEVQVPVAMTTGATTTEPAKATDTEPVLEQDMAWKSAWREEE